MPKISALPVITSPDSADELPIVDTSTSSTKKMTLTKLKEWLQSLERAATATLTNKDLSASSNTFNIQPSGISTNTLLQKKSGNSGETGLTTSAVDVTDTSLTFTLAADATLMITFGGQLRMDSAGSDVKAYMNVDGTDKSDRDDILWYRPAASGVSLFVATNTIIVTLAAGSRTIKMRGITTITDGRMYGAHWSALVISQTA